MFLRAKQVGGGLIVKNYFMVMIIIIIASIINEEAQLFLIRMCFDPSQFRFVCHNMFRVQRQI